MDGVVCVCGGGQMSVCVEWGAGGVVLWICLSLSGFVDIYECHNLHTIKGK